MNLFELSTITRSNQKKYNAIKRLKDNKTPFATTGTSSNYQMGPGLGLTGGYGPYPDAGQLIDSYQKNNTQKLIDLANSIPGEPSPVKGYSAAKSRLVNYLGIARNSNLTLSALITQMNQQGLATAAQTQAAQINSAASAAASKAAAEAARQARIQVIQDNSFARIQETLDGWGLGQMAFYVHNMIMANDSDISAQVMQGIRNSQAYKDRFAGMTELRANGGNMTENQYMQYETDVKMQLANAGIPASVSTNAEVGHLIANNVFGSNLSDRLVKGYEAAMNAPEETRKLLSQYYGMNTGDLAYYYLNPTTAMNEIIKRNQSALIATQAYDVGFKGTGTDNTVSKDIAEALSQQMTGSGYSMDYFRTGFSKAAGLQPLEQTMAGQRGQATVTSNQLLANSFTGLNQTLGSTPADDAAALKLAEQARTAGLSGGGGYVQDAGGGVGVGRTSTAGTGK